MPVFDYLLSNVKIYDGVNSGRHADVTILGNRIAAIGSLSDAQAKVHIDARDLVLLPGFIDTHTHSDLYLLHDRAHRRAVMQGVTTEIVGPCGLGYFPLNKQDLTDHAQYLKGINGILPEGLTFESADEYLNYVTGCGINVAANVSHGAVRMGAMGFNDGALSGDALKRAQDLIRQSAEAGVVGFSTGLSYYPATYADDKEVVQLAKTAAEYGLPLVSHCRSVFPDSRYNMQTRYAEFIDIAREAGCRLHFSHIKHKPNQFGRWQDFLDPFEKAMDEGMEVTLEFYPYTFGAGFAVIFLPGWVLKGGWRTALERLSDPKCRLMLEQEMESDQEKMRQIERAKICNLQKNTMFLGMTVGQAAKASGKRPHVFLLDLLLDEKLGVGHQANAQYDPETVAAYEKDYIRLMEKPYYVIGSDSEPALMLPHPRTAGTFPKLLRLAREGGLDLSVFSDCASGRAAKTFGLKDRGFVAVGYYADLVLFDSEKIKEGNSYERPDVPPEGIKYVFVNGQAAVWEGKPTGVCAGMGLRRGC